MKTKRGRINRFRIRVVWGKSASLTITSSDGTDPKYPALTRTQLADELQRFVDDIRKCEAQWAHADAKAAESSVLAASQGAEGKK